MDLITDDIFIGIDFLTSGTGSSSVGFFSYERSTEPSTDFDNNGIVKGLDFLKWQLGMSPNPFSQSNLAIQETQYGTGTPLTATSVASIPEPTTCGLALAALCLAIGRRHSR